MRLVDADKLEYTCNADECGMLTGCNHCQYNIITEDEIDSAPTVEAIPKADYENRLKADLKAILVELQLKIEEIEIDVPFGFEPVSKTSAFYEGVSASSKVIQQKINALRGEKDE